jgi:hypothetical protein
MLLLLSRRDGCTIPLHLNPRCVLVIKRTSASIRTIKHLLASYTPAG